MTVELQHSSRVRCRAIGESDLDGVADLLTRGFSRTRRKGWVRGFERWKTVPAIEEMPRHGFLLDSRFGPVGVVLLISSRRGDQILCNLAGWYVEPQWQSHASLLLSMATRNRHVTYLSTSAPPQAWRLLQTQGFSPYNFGRSAMFAMPGRGQVSETIPDALPEARLLADHRAMGWISLVVEKDGVISPFVLKPHFLGRVPVLEVMFCRSTDELGRCGGALARHFLPRGFLGLLMDGDTEARLSHYVEGLEPRFYKGPYRPILGDLAYSEKALFG